MSSRFVVVVVASVAGCGDAITLELASERPVPSAVDAVCLGIADRSVKGGHFGRLYRDEIGMLPQTLRIEAGDADGADVWARADRSGVPTLVVRASIDFSDDVTLTIPTCQLGRGDALHAVGDAIGPANALLAASQGQGGTVVLALGATAQRLADGRVLGDAPALMGAAKAVIAADLDGDCDDDAIVVTDGGPPVVWRREGVDFAVGETLGSAPMAAAAAADVDLDGDTDVVVGGGGTLALYLNTGAASFTAAPQALSSGGRVSAVSALALADIDNDGHADLIAGQSGPLLAAWLGTGGRFEPNDAALPAVQLDVEKLSLTDVDGDFLPDLAVAVHAAPMKLYMNRGGMLEDQTFPRLPKPIPTIHAIAFGGWDATCAPDGVMASEAPDVPTLSGVEGKFDPADPAPPATDVIMTDVDGDGALDAVIATPEGAQWLAR